MEYTLETIGVLVLLWIGWKLVDYLIRLPRIGEYNERYIFITGCDTGFGNATAKELDRMGCHVFAGCLTAKGEHELKSASSDRLKTLHLDVSNGASVRKAFEFVKSNLPEGKGLWGVLNNAGIFGINGPCEWLTIDDYKSCMNINTFGLIDCSTVFLPLIKKAKGRVVNTASVLGRISIPGMSLYCVTKYGVEAFSDSLRRQMRDYGVSVSIIEPGYFRTSFLTEEKGRNDMMYMWNRASDEVKEEFGEEYLNKTIEQIPILMDKVGKTDIEQVVNAYIHALTSVHPRSRYVVGFDAKFVFLTLQALPEWLGDYVLGLLTKDSPKPAACLSKN